MATHINIFKVDILKKVLLYIKTNGTQEVFENFPFGELPSTDGMDHECLRHQIMVMEKFLQIPEFYHSENLKYILDYLLVHLKFLVKSNNDVLLPVLQFLTETLARYRVFYDESNEELPAEQIGHLVCNLFNNERNIEEKRAGVLLLTELLMVPRLQLPESKVIQSCALQCFDVLNAEHAADLCRLGYAMMGILSNDDPCENRVFCWLETDCPDLLALDTGDLILYELLKCFLQFYTKVKEHFREFCLKLSRVYMKKIGILCTLKSNPSLSDFCSDLLVYIVRDLCILKDLPRAALNDDRFIQELLTVKMVTNVFELEKDIVFVLVFLEYICNKSFIAAKPIVANQILTRCQLGKTYTLPTLKALCLLYPVIIEKGEYPINPAVVEDLQAMLLKSEHFNQLIMYYPDQLAWFLIGRNFRLKVKAMLLWLRNVKDNAIILAVVDACQASQLLIDIIVYSENSDKAVCHRAAELLRQLRNSNLGKILRKNLISCKAMGYLLLANPGLPTEEKEGIFFCKVMSFRLPYLQKKHFFTLGCYYSVKLLARFKTCSEGVQQFCWNKKCIDQVLIAATGNDDAVAAAATKLLKTLILLQKRHGTKMPESTTIDFKFFLKGSTERLSQSLVFLYAILGCTVPVPILKFKENSRLELLHHLFALEDDKEVSAGQFKTLQRLLQVERHLSNSALTPLFVRAQCLRPAHKSYTAEFLSFLKEWMVNLRGLEFYALPFGILENYLREVNRCPYDEQVVELMEILCKWRCFDDD